VKPKKQKKKSHSICAKSEYIKSFPIPWSSHIYRQHLPALV